LSPGDRQVLLDQNDAGPGMAELAVNSFKTVFEYSTAVSDIRAEILFRLLIGVVVVLVGVYGLSSRIKSDGFWTPKSISPVLFMFLGIVWLAAHAFLNFVSEDSIGSVRKSYQAKKFDVVEGTVVVKHEQPVTGHDKGDIISIGGKEFEIDFYRQGPCYTATIAHGGALHNGVYARLSYVDDKILKVEIRTNPP